MNVAIGVEMLEVSMHMMGGPRGHTLGHICLYLNQSKTLITGDALNVAEGQLLGPNPQHTYDMKLALLSLKKLTQYDIATVISYHGGLYKENINQRIIDLAKEV